MTYKVEIQKGGQILCVHNPYFLMLSHAWLHICDRVCENQSYLHIKFDLILSLSNITLFPNIVRTLSKNSSYIHKIS